MNNTVVLTNQTTFRILYFRYKPFFLSGALILGVLLFWIFVIFNQIQQVLANQDQVTQQQKQLSILNQNFSVITQVNQESLNQNLQVATAALPADKNFSGILNAVSQTALAANVSLGDYTFQVGNLSKNSLEKNNNIQLVLNIDGSINEVKRFISALKNQFPLSDVTDIRINSGKATLTTVFYYLPFPQVSFQSTDILTPLTVSDQNLLRSLLLVEASASAQITPIPTSQ